MTPEDRPDRHLQAALRHAPDADLQAPDALRESIVAAARAALAADRAALPPKKRWWQALWPASPMGLGASGAFATLALGGVIALLWHGEPPPPAVVATAEVRPSAPAPAVAASPVMPETTAAPPMLKLEARRDSAAKVAPMPVREAAVAGAVAPARKAAANDVAATAPPAPTPEPPAAPAAAAPTAPAAAAADAPAAVASALPASPVVPTAPSLPVARDTAPPRAASPARLESSRLAGSAELGRAAGTLQLAPAASASAPVGEEDTRWLAEVRRVVQGRWQASSATTIPGARERRAGAVRVAIGRGRVLWCEAGPPATCTEASLEAEEESRLLGAMPR